MTQPTQPVQSIQSQVLDAVVAALGGRRQNAYRCRMTAFSARELPADNVFPDDEQVENSDNAANDVAFRFFVRHSAAAADGVDVAVDARYVRGMKLILADPTLGGLVMFTRYTGRKWEFEKGELETLALVVAYQAEFSTSRSDPSQKTAY